MVRSGVAPPAPAPAYRPSTAAIPAPIAIPTRHPLRSVDLIRKSDIGPSWRATKNPSPKPMMTAFIAANTIAAALTRLRAAEARDPHPWYACEFGAATGRDAGKRGRD